MINPDIKLVVIVGPTASGKTDLALGLAEQFNGEIVCADSRTIYRGMDIGTAKPTPEEQARVPHHLLDVVDPGDTLSVAEYKRLAETAIADIVARGRIPFLVGGSGLYIDSVLYDYQFPPEADAKQRRELESLPIDELIKRLQTVDPEALEIVDRSNPRRLIRAIETAGLRRSKQSQPRVNTLVLGLGLNKEVIQRRIQQRVQKMLERGFLDEVRRIGEIYGWESEAMSAIGYRAFRDVVLGTKSVEDGSADFARGDLQLVKKQLTWFRRNKAIRWLDDPTDAASLVALFVR